MVLGEPGHNTAAAHDLLRLAYIVEGLRISGDQYAVLNTLDAMLAMATGMAVGDSLIVCEAAGEGVRAIVRVQFAGEPAAGAEARAVGLQLAARLPPQRRPLA